jgi:hypothetical protein
VTVAVFIVNHFGAQTLEEASCVSGLNSLCMLVSYEMNECTSLSYVLSKPSTLQKAVSISAS